MSSVRAIEGANLRLTVTHTSPAKEGEPTTVVLRVENRRNGDAFETRRLFELCLAPSEQKISEQDFEHCAAELGADAQKGTKSLTLTFTAPKPESVRDAIASVTVTLALCDAHKYASYTLAVTTGSAELATEYFSMMPFRSKAPYVCGAIVSSPVVNDSFFLIPANPLVETVAYEGFVWVKGLQELALEPHHTLAYTTFIGTFPELSQLRRTVNEFVNVVRPRPYAQNLHYNSWLDIGFFNPYTEAEALQRIAQFGEELCAKRGVKLDTFLFDDGWDNRQGDWGFGPQFPNGFEPLRAAGEQLGATLGMWLSPWGGYGPVVRERVANGSTQFGYETRDGRFALSGPTYYENFHKRVISFVHDQNITMYKLDGTGNANKVIPGSRFTSDFDAAIHLLADMRKAAPPGRELYINMTTGSQATPSWLFLADSIWRSGDDVNFYGPGSMVQQWLTYRDAETYRSIVRKGPLFPLNSLMVHGIIYAKQAEHLDMQSPRDFADQVWSYFASGTQLQELYITPELLTDADWDALANAAKWCRAQQALLFDAHWIGGDPTGLEVYGWAASRADGGDAIISLRNPRDTAQVYYLQVEKDLELATRADKDAAAPEYACHIEYISTEQGRQSKPSHVRGFALITVEPLETVIFRLTPHAK